MPPCRRAARRSCVCHRHSGQRTGNSGVLANHYCYGIKYSIKGGKVGKSSKSKATKLKRKGSYKAKILLADNKSGNQWFKFKVTKKRKTQINIDATNIESGEVTAVFYRGKEKISTWTVWNGQVNPFSSVGKLPKGTYYVKITKSKKASGQYRITSREQGEQSGKGNITSAGQSEEQ